jgi:hypothetical protein
LSTIQQITKDIDNLRRNNNACVVVSPTGQQIIFYSKYLTTGKLSYSTISFTAPSFTINIEAGNGTLNGSAITWSAGILTASPNSYELVYVTSAGVLEKTANVTMTGLQTVIPLAYVSSGNSSITRIEEIAPYGYYIYVRKQILSSGQWVWDDIEYRLNTGDQPKAFYDSATQNIYLSYKKDSISYVRKVDPEDELSLEYLPNISIDSGNIITFNRDPQAAVFMSMSSGYNSTMEFFGFEYFPIGTTGFCFIAEQPYVYMPRLVENSYYQYIRSAVTYEFYTLNAGVYTLELTYEVADNRVQDRFFLWTGTTGIKYLGIALKSTLSSETYRTDPIYYKQLELYAYPISIVLDTDYSIDTRDNVLNFSMSSGYGSLMEFTATYEETKNLISEPIALSMSSGYDSPMEFTATYEETKNLISGPVALSMSSGYNAQLIIT